MIKLLPDSCYSQEPLKTVDYIVLHSISAINVPEAKDKYGMQECYDILARYQVSAHYLIGRNEGEAWQLVPYHLKAWHAGKSVWHGRQGLNHFSLGVEVIGSEKLGSYTDWQYEELARWLVEQCRTYYLTWAEITTHSAVSPGRKSDPWGMDYERVRSRFLALMAEDAEPAEVPQEQAPEEVPFTDDGLQFVDGFDFPVGSRDPNANVWDSYYVAASLVDPEYKKSFNAWHTGEDWNGRGGGDTDLGDPIYAIAHGRVAALDYYTPSWGNIVLLEHAMPNGTRVWSQYAHLDEMMVQQVGQIVKRGQQIGTLGKGERTAQKPRGRWIAHLHFEVRKNDLPPNAWRPYVNSREQVLANYHDPTSFINEHRPHLMDFSSGINQRPEVYVDAPGANEASGSFIKAEIENWFEAPTGFQGNMLWTFAAGTTEENWAEWHPNLPEEGQWEIWAFIPDQNASSTRALYKIAHTGGLTETRINQSQYVNQWVRLGKYHFKPGEGHIRLSDLTGERKRGIKVGFDTIRWVKIS